MENTDARPRREPTGASQPRDGSYNMGVRQSNHSECWLGRDADYRQQVLQSTIDRLGSLERAARLCRTAGEVNLIRTCLSDAPSCAGVYDDGIRLPTQTCGTPDARS